jgi:predicted AlkP superfamily pyrophosphatase or phosphodiesterase
MRLLPFALIASFVVATAVAGPGKGNPFGGRRVLLIGIDGCRADAVHKLIADGRAPHLGSLAENGTAAWNAYTGGELGADAQQETSSGPGWSTILTGVWRDKHGVADNRFRFHRIAQWPHWMRRIKEHAPAAWLGSLCDWPEIHDFIVAASEKSGAKFLDYAFLATTRDATGKHIDYARCDAEIAAAAVEQLQSHDPDAMFVYFGNVDETGHAVAHPGGRFSPANEPYCAALAQVDAQVGQLLAALAARPKRGEEDWLVLATTDHGGRETKHGGQSAEERTIWMLASAGGFAKGRVVEKPVPQTAIAPTVFRHLGIPVQAAWGWSEPLPTE